MAGYRDDTNSLRGKLRPGRLIIIWPHQLGFVSTRRADSDENGIDLHNEPPG